MTVRLQQAGYTVVAPALPLRGMASGSASGASLLKTVTGPKVLVGHAYGGVIISQVAAELPDVTGLVYAAALIPQPGESLQGLVSLYPGSLFGSAARTVDFPGGTDVYVDPGQFRDVFADDRSPSDAALSAATQRPIAASATTEPATQAAPAGIPKYVLVATEDHAMPPAAERFMARRANAWTVEVRSSHGLPTSHPGAVAGAIAKAAADR
ncbi:alpha/beta hydrolase [Amycolatopsis sp. NPDC051903]|uniref:alpha/beta hydrolase n=1 Tax=Amycolatopsis sp. NPDC051903 TaxID=3363936 RepID=UPI0037ACDB57